MRIEINIPGPIFERLESEANKQHLPIADFLSDHLSAYAFTVEARAHAFPKVANFAYDSRLSGAIEPASSKFEVARKFPTISSQSAKLAQEFVDAMLKYEEMTARRSRAGGVHFSDNFAHIERIYTRDSGFIASFYGNPSKHLDLNPAIGRGRGTSYARMTVRTEVELRAAIRSIPRAYQLKHRLAIETLPST